MKFIGGKKPGDGYKKIGKGVNLISETLESPV